jgi:tetratricopeptide (TPR) repeat protein
MVMSKNRAVVGISLVVGVLVSTAAACLWDSDTLEAEAKGLPDVLDVIVGRFERNPPHYYEMRLERVSKEIESRPGDLGLYDDAGVACDRLGRHDKAIAWMEKKKAQLDSLGPNDPELKDHLYRYLANLGTFHAHRWFARGADRSDMQDLQHGRDLIAQAIDLNPDAHFGREKFQLIAMEWVLDPPEFVGEHNLQERRLHSMLHERLLRRHDGSLLQPGDPAKKQQKLAPDEAVRGLAGLIVLGNAWQSIDIYYALAVALDHDEQASLANLAALRIHELARAGGRSMHPRAATGDRLIQQIELHSRVERYRKPEQRRLYEAARRHADLWHEERTAFMMARLETGRHPDTDPTFWNGYAPRRQPPLEESSARQTVAWLANSQLVRWAAIVIGVVVAAMLAVRPLRIRRRRDEDPGAQRITRG